MSLTRRVYVLVGCKPAKMHLIFDQISNFINITISNFDCKPVLTITSKWHGNFRFDIALSRADSDMSDEWRALSLAAARHAIRV